MKLDDKIHSRRIAYLLKGEASTAFELALLYYLQAKRKTAPHKKYESCLKSIYWMRKTGIAVPEDSKSSNPLIQFEEIEKLLVLNRMTVGARMPAEALVLAGALVLRSSS